MDKSRSKRPPDVNEALSSMLWTPYDQAANTSSSSSDSLTDDERQRGERKLNRYSNPLPNSLNWWNSPGVSSRYSFPYCGSYVPSPLSTNSSSSSASTAKQTVSTTIDVCNHGRAINTSTFSTTMVHSFTDDFYQYQVIKRRKTSTLNSSFDCFMFAAIASSEERGGLALFTVWRLMLASFRRQSKFRSAPRSKHDTTRFIKQA
jgi:hypothetical protein